MRRTSSSRYSETTRQDLLERFGLPAERVKVTHLGVSVVEPTPGCLPFSDAPWILYVGDRSKPYKNWRRVLDAVRALGSESRLACFGSPASADDRAAVEARGLTERVRFIGGNDHDLARIYRAAAVLVYPSLFEGFGLPPLEAMAHGCPVVAARAGAIPEITGDAALLFEPTDADALGDALTLVLADGDRVAAMRTAGRARAATYTWDRTVAATLDGYRSISS